MFDVDPGTAQGTPTLGGGTETILLVDDHHVALRVTARILERLGYTVLRADGADQALEVYRGLGARPDLVITDVIMPGLSGPELAAELWAQDPTLPVLFISGYVGRELDCAQGVPPHPLLSKPFTLEELAAEVRRVIAGSAP